MHTLTLPRLIGAALLYAALLVGLDRAGAMRLHERPAVSATAFHPTVG